MKRKSNFGTKCLALMLAISTLMMNFSFVMDKKITLIPITHEEVKRDICLGYVLFSNNEINYREALTDSIVILNNIDSVLYNYGYKTGHRAITQAWGGVKYPIQSQKILFSLYEYLIPATLTAPENRKKNHKDFSLRFMAVSAPQWVSHGSGDEIYSLDSRTPFSLQNAVRLGAQKARTDDLVWSASNWSDPALLSDSVFLLNYYEEEKDIFIKKFDEIRPHILFIGSMTLSLPGAVALAKHAKEALGENVFVVLGGKHAIETIYPDHGIVLHHPGSPTLLMHERKIPDVFDLVVSGDGEEAVEQLGNVIGSEILSGSSLKNFSEYQNHFNTIRGNVILSWIDAGMIKTFVKENNQLDYDILPSPVSLFGVNTSFPVFGKEKTAHVYSDMGKGCIMNCSFCSEANSINGKMVRTGNPAWRLYNQLQDVASQGNSMSAFVEDSILLMGQPAYLNQLADLLEAHPLDIVFGGQFTVDNLLNADIQDSIRRLVPLGFMYVYAGMETSNEEIAKTMSKNTDRKHGSWISRTEKALAFVDSLGIKHGFSILWGLGESQDDRLAQLTMISEWQKKYHGNPVCVSPNWTTQHPLFDKSPFEYIEWGTDQNDPYLPYLVTLFGEASRKYKKEGVEFPSIPEMEELLILFKKLNIQNV